jgi:hypothetical protein
MNTPNTPQAEMPKQSIPAGAVYELSVGGKKCYLKELPMPIYELVLGLVLPVQGQPQYLRAGEVILMNCWVGGDEEIKTDEALKIAACVKAMGLFEVQEAELKKL